MLSGVSRIASIFRSPNRVARAPGSDAANSSRWRRASAWTRSRTSRSRTMMKSQGWLSPTLGAWCAAASTRVSTSSLTGSARNPLRMSRRAATSR